MTTNPSILVVEDEQSLRKALVNSFEDEHFLVHYALDGETGLQKALEEHPDLIVLDILMPKLSGIQVLEKLREDAWGKTAKVIVLTNVGDSSIGKKVEALGAIDCLIKSNISMEELVGKIRGHL